jgi:hypothetical protein
MIEFKVITQVHTSGPGPRRTTNEWRKTAYRVEDIKRVVDDPIRLDVRQNGQMEKLYTTLITFDGDIDGDVSEWVVGEYAEIMKYIKYHEQMENV